MPVLPLKWYQYADPTLAPLWRSRRGSITPIRHWLLYADHRLAPMCRSVTESKCLCCGDKFTVDVRNRGRQKYCAKQSCRAAGKAARQRRWLAKPQNRNYFREADNAARVREWQRNHPGYWRNTARHKRRTLQDALPPQVHESHEETATLALQDALRLQGPVLIG
jgi:hypothetical protein